MQVSCGHCARKAGVPYLLFDADDEWRQRYLTAGLRATVRANPGATLADVCAWNGMGAPASMAAWLDVPWQNWWEVVWPFPPIMT